MGLNCYASPSPAMVLTPNQEHQSYPFGNQHLDRHLDPSSFLNYDQPGASPQAQDTQNTAMTDLPASTTTSSNTVTSPDQIACRKPVRPRFPKPPSLNYLAKTEPSSLSGRKRSLADAHGDDPEPDADGSEVSPLNPPSPPKPRGEPVYGPGMTLIYPDDPGFAIAAESQTGTWAEEKNERAEADAAASVARPSITSRKSLRLESPNNASTDPPVALNAIVNSAHLNGTNPSSSSVDAPVDRLTLILGIGWKRIPPSQAPAAKGWEKYILNHFDNISDPTILLHSEAHHLYLVRSLSSASDTQECWWVFQEDLTVSRLVGFCEADAIRNLQRGETMGPPIAAKAESGLLGQGESVSQPALQDASTTTWTTLRTTASTNNNGTGDVEMEM